MPKRLSRACAVVSEVRAERVQDISEEDAIAEGADAEFEVSVADFVHNKRWDAGKASTYRLGYKHWWKRLNATPRPKNRNPYTGLPEACYVGYPWKTCEQNARWRAGRWSTSSATRSCGLRAGPSL